MARRMFSDEITTSDAFLDMPGESQLLYFHLGMNADDDGFIDNTRMVQRIVGASDDALKLLFAKKFLLSFDNGVCVVKHWRINNQIRKDRYRETKYIAEKSHLFYRENGAYTLNPEGAAQVPRGHFLPTGDNLATNGQPVGVAGKVRLGKVRKDKVSNSGEVSPENTEAPPQKKAKHSEEDMKMVDLLISLIQANTPDWKFNGNKEAWAEHIEKLHRIDGRTYQQIEYMIRWTQKDEFWQKNILSTAKLREKFNDLIPKLKASVTKNVADQQKATKPKML